MTHLLYAAAAVAIGATLAVQPPINAVSARILGSSLLAATVSIAISLVLVLLLWQSWSRGGGDLEQIRALPWWIVVGGVVGVVFVAGSIVVAPVLGVALFFVCVIAGQLLGSTLVDQVGAFGMPVQPVNATKVLGVVLVLVGAALVETSKG